MDSCARGERSGEKRQEHYGASAKPTFKGNRENEPPSKILRFIVENIEAINELKSYGESESEYLDLEKTPPVYATTSRKSRKRHPTKNFKSAYAPIKLASFKPIKAATVALNEATTVEAIEPATVPPSEPEVVEPMIELATAITKEPVPAEPIETGTGVSIEVSIELALVVAKEPLAGESIEPATAASIEPVVVEPNESASATVVPNKPAALEPIEPTATEPNIENGRMSLGEKTSEERQPLPQTRPNNLEATSSEISSSSANDDDSEPDSDLEIDAEPEENINSSHNRPGKEARHNKNSWEQLSSLIWKTGYLELTIHERYKLIRLNQAVQEREVLEQKMVQARNALKQKGTQQKEALEQKLAQCKESLEQKMLQARATWEQKIIQVKKTLEFKLGQEQAALENTLVQEMETIEDKIMYQAGEFAVLLNKSSVTVPTPFKRGD